MSRPNVTDPIDWFATGVLWIHLESYYNRGLSPARAKELIERIVDPSSTVSEYLHCEPMCINGNWCVHVQATYNSLMHELIVKRIQEALDEELEKLARTRV
jgi:hypothetical protein